MNILTIVIVAVTVLVMAYLVATLLFPEKF
jgi:K+-transporting ATPase KdpF subunit